MCVVLLSADAQYRGFLVWDGRTHQVSRRPVRIGRAAAMHVILVHVMSY
jgi:hypothetical protein